MFFKNVTANAECIKLQMHSNLNLGHIKGVHILLQQFLNSMVAQPVERLCERLRQIQR